MVAQKDFVDIAKRHMQGVNPLYYDMKKAISTQITKQEIYNGLELAFRGGRIGEISNDITKIWNNEEISEDELDAVKYLCMETNFTIDYAKTLFKTTRPTEIDKHLKKYTKNKTPYFFQYAKGKTPEQCEPSNNSTMNRICNAIVDKSLRFDVIRPMAKIDYTLFTNGEEVVMDKKINDLYNELNLSTSRLLEKEQMAEQTKIYIIEEFQRLGYSKNTIVNSLAYFLYSKATVRKKRMLWLVYGDVLLDNLINNLSHNTNYCKKCGRRVEKGSLSHSKCNYCNDKEKKINSLTQQKEVCCNDCGEVFMVSVNNKRTKLCATCTKKKRQKYIREKVREMRQKT